MVNPEPLPDGSAQPDLEWGELPEDLDQLAVLAQDLRTSWDEPEEPIVLAARGKIAELQRRPRAMAQIDDALAATAEPPSLVPTPHWSPPLRTLADISDEPPGPLLLGMLEPDGPNLCYGAPGVGKGMTGAWLCVELQRLGMRPLVYDAEVRGREWSRRVAGLGGDRSRVSYVAPGDLPTRYAGRPLWELDDFFRDAVRDNGVDIMLVDSVIPATAIGEERVRSDPQVPYLYVQTLDALGIASVSFGHPPKGQPEGDPFGSMAWLGAMRLTWLGTRGEGEGHAVRWRPRKRNERGHISGVLLSFEYGEDGRPRSVDRTDDEESTREWLADALAAGPRPVADMAEELHGFDEEPVTVDKLERTKQRLAKTLFRMAKEGEAVRHGTSGRNVTWGLP